MEITVEMIKELREKMGCGMMDCKAAFRLNRRLQGTGLGFGRIE